MHRLTLNHLIAALVGILVSSLASAEPVIQSLSAPVMRILSAEQAHAQAQLLQSLTSDAAEVVDIPPFPRAATGKASLQPLYSSQQGSWPFESFVHAGLFKVIGNYQVKHPRMLYISGGHLTLAQVRQQLGDNEALRPHQDGFLLTYPLMIAPGATLSIEDTQLYLYAHSGAAIINQGRLQIISSAVQSWSGESRKERAYRPFIMAWAGSQTRIVDSQLSRLGYNAHLARGLSAARSVHQAASVPPARLLIRGSTLEQLSSVQLQNSDALIQASSFRQMQLYAIDAENSRLNADGNSIDEVRNHSGIRLRGASRALLLNNDIRRTGKAGIEVASFSGTLLARANVLHNNATHAVQLREMDPRGVVVLHDNRLAHASQNLVDAHGAGRLLLSENRLADAGHAISLQGMGQALILDNQFAAIEQSGIKSVGMQAVLLGGNQFDAKVIRQRLFEGDLLPVQSHIVDATISQACYLQIGAGADDQPHPQESCPAPN